jgi:hypothetical protein
MAYLPGIIISLALLAACGDDGNSTTDGGGPDGDPATACGFGSDRYLPYDVGFTWTYRITDLSSGAKETKEQSIDEQREDPTFGTVTVQTTGKLNGSTRSLVKLDGDRIVRVQQEDIDAAGAVEKTSVYDPGQLRIDESAARLTAGAAWDESYTTTETPALGGVPVMTAVVDHWEVLAASVPCESALGTFDCVRLKKTRTTGGTSMKEFFFARGVGKVKEAGDSQLEELTACGK